MKNDIIIFKERIARELIDCGFEIKSVAPHKYEPKELVYYFEDTKEIREILKVRFSITIN